METLVIIIMTHEKRFGCFTGPDNERLLREVLGVLDQLKAEVGKLEADCGSCCQARFADGNK